MLFRDFNKEHSFRITVRILLCYSKLGSVGDVDDDSDCPDFLGFQSTMDNTGRTSDGPSREGMFNISKGTKVAPLEREFNSKSVFSNFGMIWERGMV
jgi:hypothetical protein